MKKVLLALVILGLVIGVSAEYNCVGDINGDRYRDLTDLALMGRAWHTTPGMELWNPDADLDGSGYVGLRDLTILGENYHKEC